MPLQLSAPIYEEFELTEIDKVYGNEDDPTTVTIKQASQSEHHQRQQLFARLERKFNDLEPDQITLVSSVSSEELSRTEVYLSLVESNILDVDGELLFRTKKNKDDNPYLSMSKPQFINAWGKLAPDVCGAIHEKVMKVNSMWAGTEGEEF